MDLSYQTEHGFSKWGCKYDKIQGQKLAFELSPKMVVSKLSVLTV